MIGHYLGQLGRAVIAALELAPYVPPPPPRRRRSGWLRRLAGGLAVGLDGSADGEEGNDAGAAA